MVPCLFVSEVPAPRLRGGRLRGNPYALDPGSRDTPAACTVREFGVVDGGFGQWLFSLVRHSGPRLRGGRLQPESRCAVPHASQPDLDPGSRGGLKSGLTARSGRRLSGNSCFCERPRNSRESGSPYSAHDGSHDMPAACAVPEFGVFERGRARVFLRPLRSGKGVPGPAPWGGARAAGPGTRCSPGGEHPPCRPRAWGPCAERRGRWRVGPGRRPASACQPGGPATARSTASREARFP